ncbi:Mut7-C RNAse domain-containing protein [Marinobacter sp. OP 3.4]|uniref:Mut7-C RNAse domain-containing protein n=1 Tax=Marinobacter sp. OP 3.4 TaxID=3076501 RepID=UPI002E223E7C
MPSRSGPTPRFAVDAMLGRLARWLRALGFDTTYSPDIDDHDLVALANREQRILLTRDQHLITFLRPDQGLLLRTGRPLVQLDRVARAFGLSPTDDLFNRCLMCNSRLRAATTNEIATRVPERPRTLPGPFLACPGCGRIYWPGSHVRRMRRELAEIFPELRAGGAGP